MAKALNDIAELTRNTLGELTGKDAWKKYLKTAAHMYKYPFFDSMLIYAQRSDATAVASYELWNNKMHRHIDSGAKGIALVQTNSRTSRLKYVFDVSDTNGERMPYVWQYKPAFEDTVANDIANMFGVSSGDSFENTIVNAVESLVEENLPEYFQSLENAAEDSFLQDVDELSIKVWYRELLVDSVKHTVLLRCGYDTDEISQENEFSNLYIFNTPQTMIRLGESTSDLAENVLREVERSVKRIDKEQRIGSQQIGRSKSNDSIQERGQLPTTSIAGDGAGSTGTQQIRDDEERVSDEERQTEILGNDSTRKPVQPLQKGGESSADGDIKENTANEANDGPGRLADSLNRDRADGDKGANLYEIDVQSDIDTVLYRGGGFEGGKQRIVDFFAQEHTAKERADFLKAEYGVGGGTVIFENDRRGFEDHNAKGVEIHNRGFENPSIHLSWAKVANRVLELMESGEYYEQRYKNETLIIKPVKQSGQLSLFDIAEDASVEIEAETIEQKEPASQTLLERYGYGWVGMELLGSEEAIQLYDSGESVYLLYEDDTESLIENGERERLIEHIDSGGLVGVEKEQVPLIESEHTLGAEKAPILLPQNEESRLHEGQIIEHNDRTYRVETVDVDEDRLKMTDLTMPVPIVRAEPLSQFETELENAGFFDRLAEQDKPKLIDFKITEDNLGQGGIKVKFARNIEAIQLLKTLEKEGGLATAKQQETLSQYVGWGGLANAFDENKDDWKQEYSELFNLLNSDEYTQARASVLNAHYTSPTVIRAMYQALSNMGFKTGNILEPAMGVGNFVGMIPDSMSQSKVYGVELDSITGRIAKQLYQNADIDVQGFEVTDYPDNFFDVAVGNVPFGAFGVPDKRYDKHKFLIHDYFFAKSLDKVRPGGIVAFVTSKGTMDKANASVRRYIAQRAELIGAIRLPNDAFKANAGTSVTTDTIFLQKRESAIDIQPDWVNLGQTTDGISVNQYYADNPHMMLGNMVQGKGMYGNENETTCEPFENSSLSEQLSKALQHINAEYKQDYLSVNETEQEDNSIPANPGVKNYSYTIVEGTIYFRENSRMRTCGANATSEERIRGMIGIRDTVREIIDFQLEGSSFDNIQDAQTKLNTLYDDFNSGYGRINSKANSKAYSDDSSYYLLCSLEVLDDKGQFERKADLFSKLTIRPNKEILHVDTASEAIAVSLARKGKVELGYMCGLTNKNSDEVIRNLEGIIFKNPLSDPNAVYEGWETADEYLSGNIRNKLHVAKDRFEENPMYELNIQALEKVQPIDLEASEIDVRIGTVWIPPNDVKSFMFEVLNTPNYYKWDINVEFSQHSASWFVKKKSIDRDNINACETYGTSRLNAYKIIEDSLNQKSVKVYDRITDPDGKVRSVLNKEETLLATQKQTLLQEAFKDWIYKDEDRRNRLVSYYNEHFNNLRPRQYDGAHIEFIGMTPEIKLRKHQVDSIARQLYGNNTLLAHVVGAGKSFAMIAAGMESKRLGLSSKNLYVVPNHLTGQLAAEALRLYPAANVLVATKKDFQTSNRKKFCSKISTGDYDIVIIGHSQFERIPLSDERQLRMMQQEIDTLVDGIAELKREGGQNFSVKQMEATRKKLNNKLEVLNKQEKKDDVVTFEELGVDRLFVDESHMFKNLYLYTKMNNVAGIPQTEAQKSTDMYMKCQYIDEITGGRGITFATGTPISNSMTEMYTVQRYLQMGELKQRGLHHFDSWASVFGETQTAYELSPEGTRFRSKTRFSKFYNLPELMAMFKNVADIQTADMLDLPVPVLKTGQVQNISIKPTDIQKQLIEGLAERADKVHSRMVDPSIDNMLTITNDGRMIALDQRHENPLLPDNTNSKINTLMRNVFDIWERTQDERSTQLVFSDISTPKKSGQFNIYDDLRKKWIDNGVPENEIAFIQHTNNEKQKEALFAKVRSGEVRILLGSTFMMGSGMNVQNKLIAVHHADVPWRPSDLEQRNGRILRQGNENPEVEIFRYVTEGTFDSYSYQLIEQKQRYISQIMTSKSAARSAGDVDEATLTYAEVKALATGNPAIKEKMELDVEVFKLKMLKTQYRNQRYRLESRISTHFPSQIIATEERIAGLRADVSAVSKHDGDEFSIVLNEKLCIEKADAGKQIIELCKTITVADVRMSIGEYKGMELALSFDKFSRKYKLHISGALTHTIEIGSDSIGNTQRIDNKLKSLPGSLAHENEKLENTLVQLENAKEQITKPFEQEFELKQKLIRLDEIEAELDMDEKEDTQEVEDKEVEAEAIQKNVLEVSARA